MFRTGLLLLFTSIILFSSCKTGKKHTYAIKDFRASLQPHLVNVVSKGVVISWDSLLSSRITDKELVQLSQSEHPILRATALEEMLERESFDHFDVIMKHLNDTAIVSPGVGDFGIIYTNVSDNMLAHARWKSKEYRNRTADEVITKHNYLRSAYVILPSMEPQEKYYSYIREMATRKVRSPGDDEFNDYGSLEFEAIEYALYGLAAFKKKEDIPVIKDLLLKNLWRISGRSFTVMGEFPDTTYLDVYEKYFRSEYYEKVCLTGMGSIAADDFIKSIAVYKNKRSSNILEVILNWKLPVTCRADLNDIRHIIVSAIWDNPCEAYSKLRKQVEKEAKEYEKRSMEFPLDRTFNRTLSPIDTSEEKISWWN